MTPQEALQILDKASSEMQASRADHVTIQQAVVVLREKIEQKKEPPKKKDGISKN